MNPADVRAAIAAGLLLCALVQRPGTVERVIDGDTVVLDLDLGFGTHVRGPARLAGIDAPEVWTEKGLEARSWMRIRLFDGERICWGGEKRDKYGRPLVTVFDLGGNVNDAIVAAGMARRVP